MGRFGGGSLQKYWDLLLESLRDLRGHQCSEQVRGEVMVTLLRASAAWGLGCSMGLSGRLLHNPDKRSWPLTQIWTGSKFGLWEDRGERIHPDN